MISKDDFFGIFFLFSFFAGKGLLFTWRPWLAPTLRMILITEQSQLFHKIFSLVSYFLSWLFSPHACVWNPFCKFTLVFCSSYCLTSFPSALCAWFPNARSKRLFQNLGSTCPSSFCFAWWWSKLTWLEDSVPSVTKLWASENQSLLWTWYVKLHISLSLWLIDGLARWLRW